jgi:hypothetical protein
MLEQPVRLAESAGLGGGMRHALAFKTQSLLTLAGRFGRISPPAIAMQWQEWGNSGDCAGLGAGIKSTAATRSEETYVGA